MKLQMVESEIGSRFLSNLEPNALNVAGRLQQGEHFGRSRQKL